MGTGVETLQLIQQLGLQDQVITANRASRYRYLLRNGSLCRLPTGLLSFLTSPLTRRLLPVLWRERQVPLSDFEDESIEAFFSRRFSPEVAANLAELLAKLITLGIFDLSTKETRRHTVRFVTDH